MLHFAPKNRCLIAKHETRIPHAEEQLRIRPGESVPAWNSPLVPGEDVMSENSCSIPTFVLVLGTAKEVASLAEAPMLVLRGLAAARAG